MERNIYIKVNAQCNALDIPYKKRLSLYLKEIEYLSFITTRFALIILNSTLDIFI